jgi:hypothetical protein
MKDCSYLASKEEKYQMKRSPRQPRNMASPPSGQPIKSVFTCSSGWNDMVSDDELEELTRKA